MNQLTLFEQPGGHLHPLAASSQHPPEPFKLRDYQQKLKDEIYSYIRNGIRDILIYAPTGAGKTAIMAAILADALSRGKRSMLLVHRDFLVTQSCDAMIRAGIPAGEIGIIKAGYQEDRDRLIQIASLQTLQNREIPTNLDIILLDECHTTAFFGGYERVKAHTLNAIHLGFSYLI